MKLLLEPPHPFTVIPPMDSDMKNVIDAQGDRKTQHDLRERRLAAVRHWRQRAHDLRETSLAIINDLQDEPLRNHHLKGDATKTKLGEFTHVALWKEMCETVQHTDTSFIEGLVSGFPVVGRVQRSHIWPPVPEYVPPTYTLKDFEHRAWDVQRRVARKVRASAGGAHSVTLWQDMLQDRDLGNAQGPFYEDSDVAAAVGSTALFPMPRFPVIQGSKVRGVDDASISGSEVNLASSIVEKLQVPSTDYNIAVLRSLRAQVTGQIGGWVVDETRAYRQLPVHRDHRRLLCGTPALPARPTGSCWATLAAFCTPCTTSTVVLFWSPRSSTRSSGYVRRRTTTIGTGFAVYKTRTRSRASSRSSAGGSGSISH